MKLLISAALVASLTGLSVTAEAAPKKKAATKTAPAKSTAPSKTPKAAPVPKVEEEKPAEKQEEAKPAETVTEVERAPERSAPRSEKAPMRFGLGLGTNFGLGTDLSLIPGLPRGNVAAVRFRAEVTPKIVGNFDLGFRSESGDFSEHTALGIGASAQYRVFTNEAQNLHFHVLGGLGYTRIGTTVETTVTVVDPTTGNQTTSTVETDVAISDITLFGGLGAEYFFGGTNQFSMQVDVGPAIHLLGADVPGADASGTAINLFENLSSGILFTYYFDLAKK